MQQPESATTKPRSKEDLFHEIKKSDPLPCIYELSKPAESDNVSAPKYARPNGK
jgi:hypothetical protein